MVYVNIKVHTHRNQELHTPPSATIAIAHILPDDGWGNFILWYWLIDL